MVRRLQSAATLAIHLRAAEPDWSECMDSVVSASYPAPMADPTEFFPSDRTGEKLTLTCIPPCEEPRVGDLLISHPVWSVLQTTLDNSVILIVAADSLRGVTGILLNKSDDQTLESFLTACGEDLSNIDRKFLRKRVANGGPVEEGTELDSLYWIHDSDDVPGSIKLASSILLRGNLQQVSPAASLCFFHGCAKWSWPQMAVDLERGLWIHARPCAQSLRKVCFQHLLATRDVWYAAMMATAGPSLADFPRGPAADPILKQALVAHYRAQATDIARQLFGQRSAEWERRLQAAKSCKAKS
ncbi:unnamed protein product [Durusdinium trenchii]|uniref:Uncharacterized protein n=3 Tax=Durusdinium trenchii TaxID=1381693 RepID=A0ABP0NNN7_9DINO